jgi:hypothetical protein
MKEIFTVLMKKMCLGFADHFLLSHHPVKVFLHYISDSGVQKGIGEEIGMRESDYCLKNCK